MIRNERQYRITKARIEEFERTLADVALKTGTTAEDNLWIKVQQDAIASQLEDLRSDARDYEALRARGIGALEVRSLEEIPRALVRARIALGLTHKGLADRLGVKEQQIQRYEATDYAGASLERIREVMGALGLRLSKGVLLPTTSATLGSILRRTRVLGLPKEFVYSRLLPSAVQSTLRSGVDIDDEETEVWAVEAASRLGRVFSWTPEKVIGGAPLSLRADVVAAARFKAPVGRDQQFFAAYAVYAHYLALVLLQATVDIRATDRIPVDADVMRERIVASRETVTLEGVLAYCWDELGIPVLPLDDTGAFHGACWRIKGRSVIVVKQRTSSSARWIIDLLHEIRHLATHHSEGDLTVIEPEILTKDSPADLVDEETEATEFAGQVALDGRAEELVEKCVRIAHGKVEWLKNAVARVAKEEGIGVDLLANYMAYRLSLQSINWWGAAQNLQQEKGDPWRIARDYLLLRANLEYINPIDKELLLQALSDPSGYGI